MIHSSPLYAVYEFVLAGDQADGSVGEPAHQLAGWLRQATDLLGVELRMCKLQTGG